MTTPAEAYAKLKAPKPTDPTELCKCTGKAPIKISFSDAQRWGK